MSKCARLIKVLCRGEDPEERSEQVIRTDDLIDEAERTRRELSRLTTRLAQHVAALQTLTKAYARQREEPGRGGA